jgi:hypothetical protein
LMAFQQFCGFNTLMYYSSTLFQIVSLLTHLQCPGYAQDPALSQCEPTPLG